MAEADEYRRRPTISARAARVEAPSAADTRSRCPSASSRDRKPGRRKRHNTILHNKATSKEYWRKHPPKGTRNHLRKSRTAVNISKRPHTDRLGLSFRDNVKSENCPSPMSG